MATQEDMLLARLLLKKGWVKKEVLLKALKEVEEISKEDPEANLGEYLAVTDVLPWEKIDLALKALEQLKKKKKPPQKKQTPPDTHRRKEAKPVGAGKPKREFRRRKKRSAAPAVAVATAVCLVLAIGAYFFLSSKGNEKGESHTSLKKQQAPQVSYQEKLAFERLSKGGLKPKATLLSAEKFLSTYPDSKYRAAVEKIAQKARLALAQEAESKYQLLEASFPEAFKKHAFSDLILNLEKFCNDYAGTAASKKASSAIQEVKRRWARAVAEKLDEISVVIASGDYSAALSELQDLRSWCDPAHSGFVAAKVLEVREKSRQKESTQEESSVASADTGEGEALVAGTEGIFGPSEESKPGEESKQGEEVSPTSQNPPETSTAGTVVSKKSTEDVSDLFGPDASEDLFGEEVSVKKGTAAHPLAKALQRYGQEKLEKELTRVFACSRVEVHKDGKVSIDYNFGTRREDLAKLWTPKIGRQGRIRWSVDYEGDLMRVFYGVRVSEKGFLLSKIPLKGKFRIELSFNNSTNPGKGARLLIGVFDEKQKMWYGNDFGAAVRADANGRVKEVNGHRELPEALTVRWYRVDYENGKLTTWWAITSGRGGGIGFIFQEEPNYRKTGELVLSKKPGDGVKAGFFFYDLVGTVGFVRITGYVDPAWLEERIVESGADIELEKIKLEEL